MSELESPKRILVTGGSGYIASWVVKYLLQAGHRVHATVRRKHDDVKTNHLMEIAGATSGELKLFEANLLKDGSFDEAAQGCQIIMHLASPFQTGKVKDPQTFFVNPAVQGTRNVLDTANRVESVERVVLTSSVVSIMGDAIEAMELPDHTFTEKQWNETSTLEYQPYAYSKTLAEKEAWKMAQAQSHWKLVVINPAFVLGPSLSTRQDAASVGFMRDMVNGKFATGVPDLYLGVVDVRDVARAHIEAGFRENAAGRHILCNRTMSLIQIAEIIKGSENQNYKLPHRVLPKVMVYAIGPLVGLNWAYLKQNLGQAYQMDNSRSKSELGIKYHSIEDTLRGHVKQLNQAGLIKT